MFRVSLMPNDLTTKCSFQVFGGLFLMYLLLSKCFIKVVIICMLSCFSWINCLKTLGRFVVDYLPFLSFISSLLKDIRIFLGFVVDYLPFLSFISSLLKDIRIFLGFVVDYPNLILLGKFSRVCSLLL
jgi:hypothetical protein